MIEGKKISLRTAIPGDLDILFQWENDPSVWQYGVEKGSVTKKKIKKFINESQHDLYLENQLRLLIERKPGKKPIGCIDLFDFDSGNRTAGVGILIGNEKERKKGYATESLLLLSGHAFHILGIKILTARVSSENKASMNLFLKCGFKVSEKKRKSLPGKTTAWEYLLQLNNS